MIDYYGVVARKLGVEGHLNTEANAKFMRSVRHEYDVCIVAASARTDMAVFQYLEGADLLVDALEVAHGRVKTGKRVGMIGGGMIGPDHFRIPRQGRARSHRGREGETHRRRHHADLQVTAYRLGR